jgi:2-C-methyl-D-erythritol 4-phosphate cytidylyltransferase
MKKFAVIVAGGAGVRMGGALPKQFLLVHGRPVLWHTLSVFLAAYADLEIVLVLPAEHMEAGRAVVDALSTEAGHALPDALPASSRIRLVAGGPTRFDSVRNGLELVAGNALIAVHDGVRCLVSVDLVRRCFEQAERLGSAVPVVDCGDSVRLVRVEGSEPIDRSHVKLVQTPQTFRGSLLLRAYEAAAGVSFTDDATVVEASGVAVHLIEGERANIKITLPIDLVIAERVLEARAGGGASGAGD